MNRNIQPIIWFALVMSTAVYVALAWLSVGARSGKTLGEAVGVMPVPVLYGMAAMMFVAAFAAARFLAPRSEFSHSAASEMQEAKLKTARIVQWALLESVCIFGLMAAFMLQTWTLVLPPFALSLAGFVMTFPSAPPDS